MTDEERKKKIVEIISPYVVERWHDKIANALIAVWIGDVSSEKAMRELAEAFHREKCAEYDLLNYQMQKSEYRVVEAEHRAEVAEQKYKLLFQKYDSFFNDVTYCHKNFSDVDSEITKQAEKELAEKGKDVE